jgi:rhamnogalacturonan endolyase
MLKILFPAFCALSVLTNSYGQSTRVLLHDDFSLMRSEKLSSDGGAHTEYHFLPELYGRGNWNVASFYHDRDSYNAWKVFSHAGKKVIAQTKLYNKISFTHPMLVAGDSLWKDYTVNLRFLPQDTLQSGLVFRYKNSNCYYFFGVRNGKAILKKVNYHKAFHVANEVMLDSKPFDFQPGNYLNASVTVNGSSITASLNGQELLHATDGSFSKGKVGLLADAPTYFTEIKVTTTASQAQSIARRTKVLREEQTALESKNPAMRVWKKINTDNFGTGRNLRFGDLDGDGKLDILVTQPNNRGPKDKFSEVGVMTAITLEGKVLWKTGEGDPWKTQLTSDVGVQIHDLNGDGKNEVIYCKDQEIVVLEGKTGKVLLKKPTPRISDIDKKAGTDQPYDRILGDCIFFADFRGLGRKGDMLVKDRYNYFWVMDDKLNPLWNGKCRTGHFPFAKDIDNDGKDELAIGYSLYDDNGTILWSLDSKIKDHADGVAIVDFKGDGNLKLLNAASDEGMLFIDKAGKILKHHYIGHAQNPVVANFRDDLPGLETLSINFWGNQGIIHLYDSDGNIYHDFEPAHHGSMCMALNWTGKGEEYFVLSPNPEIGGIFNGHGKKVLNFPDDGHPDQCYAVLDMTGDARDEIVVWDPYEIWIYTQDGPAPSGKIYKPVKNALFNSSNYQTTVSLPGWE